MFSGLFTAGGTLDRASRRIKAAPWTEARRNLAPDPVLCDAQNRESKRLQAKIGILKRKFRANGSYGLFDLALQGGSISKGCRIGLQSSGTCAGPNVDFKRANSGEDRMSSFDRNGLVCGRLIARTVAAAFVVWSLIFALTAQLQAQTGATLRGIVTLDSPVAVGTILISNGPYLLQAESGREFNQGTFEIELNPQVTALLSNADLRVSVQVQNPRAVPGGSSSLTLSAVLHDFDPASGVVFINPVTTVISAYLDDNPNVTWEEAADEVASVLGVPTRSTFESTHMFDFDSTAFITASEGNGGFDAYVHAVAGKANKGESVNFTKGPAAVQAAASSALAFAPAAPTRTPEFGTLIVSVAKSIASHALEKFPVADALVGWVIDEYYAHATGLISPTEQDKTSLTQIGNQLDQISAQISNLALQITNQINELKEAIRKSTDYIVYQQVATSTEPAVTSLDNMRKNLQFLAMSGGAGEFNPDEATALKQQIFLHAGANLLSVEKALEGANSIPGLIPQWAKILTDQNPTLGYPVFFDNDYLAPATTQYEYYLGAEFIGFDLLVEYAHTIQSAQPSSAKQRILDAVQTFNLHYNKQMKLIAGNTYSSLNGKNYYPSLPLPSDEVIADGKHGRLWLRTNACAPEQKNTSPCLFTTPNAVKRWPQYTKGLPLAGPFVESFSIAGVNHWSLPYLADVAEIISNGQKYEATHPDSNPGNWLNLNGFQLKNVACNQCLFTRTISYLVRDRENSTTTLSVNLFGTNSGSYYKRNWEESDYLTLCSPYFMVVMTKHDPNLLYLENPAVLPIPKGQ